MNSLTSDMPNSDSQPLALKKLGDLLGDECFQNGLYKHADEYGTGAPIIRINDFDNSGRLLFRSFNRVSVSVREYQQFSIREQDILINRVNSLSHVGKSMLVPSMIEYPVYESNMMRLRIGAENPVDPEYVAVVLQGEAARKHLRKVAKPAVAQVSINQDDVRSVLIVVHPKPVQKRISEIDSVWNAAIEKTEKLIAAKGQRLGALRKNLFVRSSRPGYVRVKLSTVLQETEELSDGNLPVYSVSVHKGLINQVEHLGRSFSAATTTHYNLVKPGDIVYTKSPTGEFPYGIVKQSLAKENAAVSPLYGIYRPSTNDIGTLVDFFFESPVNAKNYLHPLVQKGAKNTISIGNDQFLQGEVTLPGSPGQIARLASFIREARTEIGLLEKSLAALTNQKRGLMQKLLTGRWQVKVPETEAA